MPVLEMMQGIEQKLDRSEKESETQSQERWAYPLAKNDVVLEQIQARLPLTSYE